MILDRYLKKKDIHNVLSTTEFHSSFSNWIDKKDEVI